MQGPTKVEPTSLNFSLVNGAFKAFYELLFYSKTTITLSQRISVGKIPFFAWHRNQLRTPETAYSKACLHRAWLWCISLGWFDGKATTIAPLLISLLLTEYLMKKTWLCFNQGLDPWFPLLIRLCLLSSLVLNSSQELGSRGHLSSTFWKNVLQDMSLKLLGKILSMNVGVPCLFSPLTGMTWPGTMFLLCSSWALCPQTCAQLRLIVCFLWYCSGPLTCHGMLVRSFQQGDE